MTQSVLQLGSDPEAAVLPPMAAASDWLTIELACARADQQVVFRITFRNVSPVAQQLPFSNRARKAEYRGLRVADAAGQLVRPERTLLVKPRIPDPDLHPLASGEAWTYELAGEVTAVGLEFPASLFRLRRGQTYTVSFAYKGVVSNTVPLVL